MSLCTLITYSSASLALSGLLFQIIFFLTLSQNPFLPDLTSVSHCSSLSLYTSLVFGHTIMYLSMHVSFQSITLTFALTTCVSLSLMRALSYFSLSVSLPDYNFLNLSLSVSLLVPIIFCTIYVFLSFSVYPFVRFSSHISITNLPLHQNYFVTSFFQKDKNYRPL